MSEKPKQSRSNNFILLILVVAAIGMLFLGLAKLNERRIATTEDSPAPIANQTITSDVETPDETKPTEAYNVPPGQPRRIILSSINTEGYIQRVGINDKNAISVPTNIHFAGWYTESVKPGDDGLSIIDGHVSGRYTDGIFKDLANLKIGDKFTIEYGDLSVRSFEVADSKTLAEKDSAEYLFTKNDSITRQLNLITCGGKFNKTTQTYDDRVVIVSKAIN